jgi:ERCC4-type nuclease
VGIFLDLHEQLKGLTQGAEDQYEAVRCALSLGDFAWVQDGTLIDGCVERKKVGDLVSRSARGDHLDQVRP